MAQIKITFEVSDDFIKHLKRIKEQYNMGPQQFAEEAIYAFQSKCWSDILSMTVDSPLQENPVCYFPQKCINV